MELEGEQHRDAERPSEAAASAESYGDARDVYGEGAEEAPGPGCVLPEDDLADLDGIAFEDLQRELERGLADALGGFEVLDRDLEFDGGPTADLVGVDGTGRLVLVLLLDPGEGQGDALLGRALDLVALAGQRRGLLERHLGRTLSADAPIAVLVAEQFAPTLARRVAVLGGLAVRLLQARELRSARGSTTWFAPVGGDLTAAAPGAAHAPSLEAFAEQLDAELAPLVHSLAQRLARLDHDLAVARTAEGLEWRWRGRALCSVSQLGDALEGRLETADGGTSQREIADETGAEAFVDAALARFLDLADELPPSLGGLEGGPGLRDVELTPRAADNDLRGPLLSEAEVQALRDED